MSDRVAILVRGRVRQIGTVTEVRRWGMRERVFRIEIEPHPGPLAGPYRVLDDQTAADARRLAIVVEGRASLHDVLHSAPVLAHFQRVVTDLAKTSTGSASRIARLCLLSEPPTIDRGEVTDKGSINQRAVLVHRADIVAKLHDDSLHAILKPQ